MHRKSKRDPKRKAPEKSEYALRFVDRKGKLMSKTTTFVTPEMRNKLPEAKENW